MSELREKLEAAFYAGWEKGQEDYPGPVTAFEHYMQGPGKALLPTEREPVANEITAAAIVEEFLEDALEEGGSEWVAALERLAVAILDVAEGK
jgi:hypothetical protein